MRTITTVRRSACCNISTCGYGLIGGKVLTYFPNRSYCIQRRECRIIAVCHLCQPDPLDFIGDSCGCANGHAGNPV